MRTRLLVVVVILALAALLAAPALASTSTPTYNQAVDKVFAGGYPKTIETYLNSLGTSPLGFRLAGTAADDEAARYLAMKFAASGLSDVALEPVPVDEWDVQGAWVRANGRTMVGSQFAGVPGTDGPVSGEIVYVGNGTRQDFDKAGDVTGKLVLIDTALENWWLNLPGAQATARGAIGIVMTYGPDSAPWYEPMTSLGANDGEYDRSWLPIVYISRADGAWLKQQIAAYKPPVGRSGAPAGLPATMRSDVEVTMHGMGGGEGYNVIARIPGYDPDAPAILVASHHDAHFRAGLDDTGAVAAQMAMARAFKLSGYRPRGDVIFLSTTAEEFGYTDSWYDWCIGAWWAITQTHKDWPGKLGAMVNLELMARKGGPLNIRTNSHLIGWVKEQATAATKSGRLPWGYKWKNPQTTWQDGWTFNTAGVPSFVLSAGGKSYDDIYHTDFENQALVSWPYLANITKFAGSLVKKLNVGLLPYDPAAQARHLTAAVEGDDPAGSGVDQAAVTSFREALHEFLVAATVYKVEKPDIPVAQRRTVNRNLMSLQVNWSHATSGLEIWDYEAYPYQQALWDAQSLDGAVAALTAATPDPDKALAALGAVGLTWNGLYFDYDVYLQDLTRHAPDYPLLNWAGQVQEAPHLDVMKQVAALQSPGADYVKIAGELTAVRDSNLTLVGDRLGAMTKALQIMTLQLQNITVEPT